jgi:transposase
VRQTEYQWVYLWAAVEPLTGVSGAMITPTVNTELMNRFLAGLSAMAAADEQIVLALDNAGWHVAEALAVPGNVTLLFFPPYAPELNPAERVWAYPRSHHLSDRVYRDYNHVLEATDEAWLKLDAGTLKSVCRCSWIERAVQS